MPGCVHWCLNICLHSSSLPASGGSEASAVPVVLSTGLQSTRGVGSAPSAPRAVLGDAESRGAVTRPRGWPWRCTLAARGEGRGSWWKLKPF